MAADNADIPILKHPWIKLLKAWLMTPRDHCSSSDTEHRSRSPIYLHTQRMSDTRSRYHKYRTVFAAYDYKLYVLFTSRNRVACLNRAE